MLVAVIIKRGDARLRVGADPVAPGPALVTRKVPVCEDSARFRNRVVRDVAPTGSGGVRGDRPVFQRHFRVPAAPGALALRGRAEPRDPVLRGDRRVQPDAADERDFNLARRVSDRAEHRGFRGPSRPLAQPVRDGRLRGRAGPRARVRQSDGAQFLLQVGDLSVRVPEINSVRKLQFSEF